MIVSKKGISVIPRKLNQKFRNPRSFYAEWIQRGYDHFFLNNNFWKSLIIDGYGSFSLSFLRNLPHFTLSFPSFSRLSLMFSYSHFLYFNGFFCFFCLFIFPPFILFFALSLTKKFHNS